MKKLAFVALVMLAGCDQSYRYPCQDPRNWEKEQCQRPMCEVNRDCPDHIFKQPKQGMNVPGAPIVPNQNPIPQPPGACK